MGSLVSGQRVRNENSSGATSLATGAFAADVTAGNFIQLAANSFATDTTTVTKNSGTATIGTPVLREDSVESGTGGRCGTYVIPVTGSGTLDILVSWLISLNGVSVEAVEVTGVSGVDSSVSAAGGDAGNNPTGTITDTVVAQPGFAVMMGTNFQGGTLTQGTGWTLQGAASGTVDRVSVQTKPVTATGSLAGSFANAGFDRNTSSIVVYNDITPPTITSQPVEQTGTVGGTVTFTVTATSIPGSPTYQWQEQVSGTWTNVSTGTGGTTASYTTAALTAADSARQFRCLVTDANGTTASHEPFLFITGLPLSGTGRYFKGWALR
jgi:hypothetical protein